MISRDKVGVLNELTRLKTRNKCLEEKLKYYKEQQEKDQKHYEELQKYYEEQREKDQEHYNKFQKYHEKQQKESQKRYDLLQTRYNYLLNFE
ncbi:hypothetical protein F8M41_007950 [Gigaspora margarita]|uniref:Uncharacterized protein n=1 Tax=Gigaspora margarita TaxID=4874 RepID=A0A8H3X4Z9_GIGMA|nr:hypothetical protein F8M41_007950 [Gigaspora margarita]